MIPCFVCSRRGCRKLPHPGCDFQPASWKKYVRPTGELAVVGVGGLRRPKW